jgi:WD40 repeat protein
MIAVGIEDFGVEIWDPAGKRRIATLREPSGAITDVRWSGNGQYLLVVSHGQQRVHVYGSADWKLLGTLVPHEQTRIGVGVRAAGVGNDGSVLLVPQGARGIDTYQLK